MDYITKFNELIYNTKDVHNILHKLQPYTYFILSGLYAPDKIYKTGRFKKFSLTNNNKSNSEWIIYIHIGRQQRQLEHGNLGDITYLNLIEISQDSSLTNYLIRQIHDQHHKEIHSSCIIFQTKTNF